jgi:hypothetical protein
LQAGRKLLYLRNVNFNALKRKGSGPSAKGGKKKGSLNKTLIMGVLSVMLCWFFGLPGLILGYFSLRNVIRLKRSAKKLKPQAERKMQWALYASVCGLAFSIFFCIFYMTALITGAYISLW